MQTKKITGSTLARITGVKPQYISTLKKSGKLITDEDGFYHLTDSSVKNYLISKGVNINSLIENDFNENNISSIDIPEEFKNFTVPELLKVSIPVRGKNLPYDVWCRIWQAVERGKRYYHGKDQKIINFEELSGLPYTYSSLTLAQAIRAAFIDNARLQSPPPLDVIITDLRSVFKM